MQGYITQRCSSGSSLQPHSASDARKDNSQPFLAPTPKIISQDCERPLPLLSSSLWKIDLIANNRKQQE